MTVTDPRARYERDGYVIFREVLDPDLVAEADRHVDWLLAKHPGIGPDQLDHHLARDDPFWIRLVSDPRLLDIGEVFIGPDIALFATHYICKPPHGGRPVLWHQDGAFWPLEPMTAITLWLAVTRSDPRNGCLRVIPGTHTLDLQAMREQSDVDSVLGREIDHAVDESQAVDLVLNPGDVSVHHPQVVHGSNGNTSERWRRGLTIRYIPTSTRITDPEAASPFLLRGQPSDSGNSYLPRPSFRDDRHMAFSGNEDWR